MFSRDLGLSLEYIEGRHRVECRLTGNWCSLCEGASKLAQCQYARLVLDGLHPIVATHLYVLCSEEVWRQSALQCFYQTGAYPGKASKHSKAEVDKRIADPLYQFPNDVEYFTSDQIASQIRLSDVQDSFSPKRPEHFKWNKDRAEACKGKQGAAAKRCSMNDMLWGRYMAYRDGGVEMTLEMVEKLIRMDLALSRLRKTDNTPEGEEALEELRNL